MKIKVSIVREYDTEDQLEDAHDLEKMALHYFAEDIDQLVKYNTTAEHAIVEVLS